MELHDAVHEAALHALWRRGAALPALLDEGQIGWVNEFYAQPPLSSSVWLIGRQRGKTYAAVALALDFGVRNKDAIMRYCAKTKDSAIAITGPAWKALTAAMPEDLRPVKGRNEFEWRFPSSGAVFVLFGTDSQSFSKGRGPKTDLQFYDEAGFYQDLQAVEAALKPALQTTGGKQLFLSTPAESLGHYYTSKVAAAREAGRLVHGTFWDNPRVDHAAIITEGTKDAGLTSEDDFIKSTFFRREYLAEEVQEELRAGFPALVSWDLQQSLIDSSGIPQDCFDGYTSCDLGIRHDPHAAVFAVHDWHRNILHFVDELVLTSGVTTLRVYAEAVKAKELELYGESKWTGAVTGAHDWRSLFGDVPEFIMTATAGTKSPVYLRVVDDAQGAAKELSMEHKLSTFPAHKHHKATAVDALNGAIVDGRVKVHSRCKGLIEQLKSATWDVSKKQWIRTASHHFDLVDCAVMLHRHWVRSRAKLVPQPKPLYFGQPDYPGSKTGLENLKGIF